MMTIAKDWSEVTIGQYQEICLIQSETTIGLITETISVLNDIDPYDVRKLPLTQFMELRDSISFVFKDIPNMDIRKTFEIDGVEYGFINDLDFISAGEFIDVETWKNDSVGNLHLFASLLWRPIIKKEGDYYKIDEYKVEGFMRRAELFRDRLSIEKMYGGYLFFSLFVMEYMQTIADSLTEEDMKEMMEKEKKTGKKKVTRKPTKKSK